MGLMPSEEANLNVPPNAKQRVLFALGIPLYHTHYRALPCQSRLKTANAIPLIGLDYR